MKRPRLALAALAAAAVLVTLLAPPVRQDQAYHRFADGRGFLGVPNFLDVVSNLPFAVVGGLGLARSLRGRSWERAGFAAVFAAVGLTAFGSAYYHLAPDDARLFWDRLPIAIVAMALLAVTIADRIDARLGRRLLAPLVAAGVAGAVWWRETGDLRFYALVQFFPALAIPVMLLWLPARHTRNREMWTVLGLWAVSRVCEVLDAQIFALSGVASGHTLKHLAAAGAAYWMLRVARTE